MVSDRQLEKGGKPGQISPREIGERQTEPNHCICASANHESIKSKEGRNNESRDLYYKHKIVGICASANPKQWRSFSYMFHHNMRHFPPFLGIYICHWIKIQIKLDNRMITWMKQVQCNINWTLNSRWLN